MLAEKKISWIVNLSFHYNYFYVLLAHHIFNVNIYFKKVESVVHLFQNILD